MLRKIALLSTLLLCACEPYASPAPNIVSIEPEEVVSGQSETLLIKLDAPLPVKVDYGAQTASLVTPTLLIGGQEVTIIRVEQDGTLLASVPGSLSAGLQDVRLELGDGNESISEQGLTVLPPPPAMEPWNTDGAPGDPQTEPGTGGENRDMYVTGLRIDPIPDQVRGVPFSITLHAEGPEAAFFAGQVQISSRRGNVEPHLSNSFSQGVLREQVVIDKPGANMVLTVSVGSLVARSNPFKVSPK